jgi:hypothetical protein
MSSDVNPGRALVGIIASFVGASAFFRTANSPDVKSKKWYIRSLYFLAALLFASLGIGCVLMLFVKW